jgi:hypothetical protein
MREFFTLENEIILRQNGYLGKVENCHKMQRSNYHRPNDGT